LKIFRINNKCHVWVFEKIQIQRIISFGYFKKFKALLGSFTKEPAKTRQFLRQLIDIHGYSQELRTAGYME
jgi:hypothetical protein